MQRGKSDIQKRPAGTAPAKQFKEIRIKIKRKTAENIVAMNNQVSVAKAALIDAQRELENHVLPLLTERGLENSGAMVAEVTEKEPYQLVLKIPK